MVLGEKKEHGIISELVGGCFLGLNLHWPCLIGIRIAAILKNAFRYQRYADNNYL